MAISTVLPYISVTVSHLGNIIAKTPTKYLFIYTTYVSPIVRPPKSLGGIFNLVVVLGVLLRAYLSRTDCTFILLYFRVTYFDNILYVTEFDNFGGLTVNYR